jgi:cytochrome P450 family 313
VTIRIFKFWLHNDFLFNRSSTNAIQKEAIDTCAFVFTPKVMKSIRKKMAVDDNNNQQDSGDRPKTFIRAFMDPKNNFSESEIVDEINTLIVAAQDTSALATSSTLLLLAMHKDVQDNVVKELREVLGKSAGNLDIEQLDQLEYLDRVINEAMRLIPVVPLIARTNQKELITAAGYTIPANSCLVVHIFSIHRNKATWGDDADEFKPDRFEKENIEKIHPYAFIPFAKGSRMCIGWRYATFLMKIQLANVLLRFELDTSLKLDELDFKYNVTLNVCQGHRISIKNRN